MRVYYHEDALAHLLRTGHPESPERVRIILEGIEDVELRPPAPLRAKILHHHDPEYLAGLLVDSESDLDPDTVLHPETSGYAHQAAATTDSAAIAAKAGHPSFALVRPPGHHAGVDFGGGFCYLNNAFLAAQTLLEDVDRVAILDIDGHHGNGTQEMAKEDPRVLYISTHQSGIFPGTGHAEEVGTGNLLNMPFLFGAGDSSFLAAWVEVIDPVIDLFKPQALVLSLGLDSHYLDPLTGLVMSSDGYMEILGRIMDRAKSQCHGRIVSVLEGGYSLRVLGEVVPALIHQDLDARFEGLSQDESLRGREEIDLVKSVQRDHWEID